MALRAAMRCTPIASVIVITAGRPSGMAATARPTTAMNASRHGSRAPGRRRRRRGARRQDDDGQSGARTRPSGGASGVRQRLDRAEQRADRGRARSRRRSRPRHRRPAARRPGCPRRPCEARSPSAASAATGSVPFSTGDRLAGQRRLVDLQVARAHQPQVGRHAVAGSSSTTSPGNEASAGTTVARGRRGARGRGSSMVRIASSARSARPSWTKPMSALTTTTARITSASTQWPISSGDRGRGEQDIDQEIVELPEEAENLRFAWPPREAGSNRCVPCASWPLPRKGLPSRFCNAAKLSATGLACHATPAMRSGSMLSYPGARSPLGGTGLLSVSR